MVMATKRVMVTATRVGEQVRWQRGWQAIDGNKGDGDGDGDDVVDGDSDEAGGRRRWQG